MRSLLHIITKEHARRLAQQIIARQREHGEWQVEVLDWTEMEPDYRVLLEKIFAADSIEVW